MSDVTLSSAVRNNLLSLQNTAKMMAETQNRLATGKKVTSALDNPTNFFTAAALDSRASDINTLLDSVSNGIQTLKAADTGITSLQKLVDSAKATARQALQSPNAYTSKASLSASAGGLTAADLTGIIAGTGVNASTGTGTTAIDLTTTPEKVATEVFAAIADDTAAAVNGSDFSTAGAAATDLINDAAIFDGNNGSAPFAAGDTLTFSGAAGSFTLNVTTAATGTSDANNIRADDTIANLVTKLQAGLRQATGDTGATVTFDDANDRIQIAMSDNAKDFTIGGNSSKLGIAAGTSQPTNATLAASVAAGYTASVQVGDGPSKTLYFGTGDGQITNRRDLIEALNTVSGLSTSLNDTTNVITVSTASATDKKSSITMNFSNAALRTALGVGGAAGSDTTASTTNGRVVVDAAGTSATIYATNLLDQVGNLQGKTLTVGVGSDSKTFTFGTGQDEVTTYDELVSGLASIGAELTMDAGKKLTIATSAVNIAKSLQISGNAATTLGINTGTFSGTGDTLSGKTLTVTTGSGSTLKASTFTFGSGAGEVKSLDDLNAKLKDDGIDVQASLDSDGKLSLTSTNAAARETFSVSGTAAVQAFGAASAFTQVDSTDPVFGGTGDDNRRSLVKDYNDLLKQINTLAQDSSYNGINLLNGDDLSLVFNENGTSNLDIKGVTFDASGLGLESLNSDGSDFLDSNSINAVLDKLDAASTTLRTQASKFGSNLSIVQTRQDFSKNLINVLQTGSANLTLADTNEEGANLLALQTRQQLSTTALSMASQADQAVLRLF